MVEACIDDLQTFCMQNLSENPNEQQYKYALLLSDKLRNLRAESSLTQEAVANAAGLTTNTYQKFEKGESRPGCPMNPTIKTLIALSNVFDVEVYELLKFD